MHCETDRAGGVEMESIVVSSRKRAQSRSREGMRITHLLHRSTVDTQSSTKPISRSKLGRSAFGSSRDCVRKSLRLRDRRLFGSGNRNGEVGVLRDSQSSGFRFVSEYETG